MYSQFVEATIVLITSLSVLGKSKSIVSAYVFALFEGDEIASASESSSQ